MSEICVDSHSRRIRDNPAFSWTLPLARDQRFHLETSGWRIWDIDGNPLPDNELERQREKIMFDPLSSPGPRISFSGGPDCGCVDSLSVDSDTLVDCYRRDLGSGYTKALAEYPIFDVRLLKRCLSETASVVFGTLGPFLMTEFIVTRLKGAQHRDWMQLRQSLRVAIETGDVSLPSLPDVFSDIIGVRPLIVSCLKQTGKKDNGDSLLVWLFL